MPKLTIDDIRKRFDASKDFNEIFDAFKQAIEQRLDNIELYRTLFWNTSLKAEELCLFGEKLAKEFTHLNYDVYMWLASVFEVTHSVYDNYDLALRYYRKAADAKPTDPMPYLNAANCYEPDLKIPPINVLIDFLKHGVSTIPQPTTLQQKLASLYELAGNDEMSKYFQRKAEEGKPQAPDQPPAE